MDSCINGPSYWLRRQYGPRLEDGAFSYEEEFLIAHGRPYLVQDSRTFLCCDAYGEGVWRQGYKLMSRSLHWSFEMITDGDAVFVCDDRRHSLTAGDIYIIRPGSQVLLHPGDAGFLKKRCAIIEGPLLEWICEGGRLGGLDFVRPSDLRRLTGIYDELKNAILADAPLVYEDVSVQCYALLSEISRLAAADLHPVELQKALEHIDANLKGDLSLRALSGVCGVSSRTLSRLFTRHLGVSPINYVINRRLTEAKMLVQLGGMSRKEVAARCGYENESFLSRAFKRKFGKSPKVFREFCEKPPSS